MIIISQKRKIGAGDFVEFFAQPIARGVDAVAGTKLADCQECPKRKEKLNAAVPDIFHPLRKK